MHQEIADNAHIGHERWSNLQERHEQALFSLQKYTSDIDNLKSQITELKEINMQVEFEWDWKYSSMLESKNSEIWELREEMKTIIQDLKSSHAQEMAVIWKGFGLNLENVSWDL